MLKNIVDGFSYNSALLYLPCRFFPNALAQLDILRRAANYRAKWYVAPEDILAEPVAAYDTFQTQIRVNKGSYLWGYSFCTRTVTVGGYSVPTNIRNLYVQVTDSCSEIPLGSDFQNANGLRPTGNAGTDLYPCLMSQPRLILEPGLVNIEIANAASTAAYCQLLLLFAEPCEQVDEDLRNPCAR